MRRIDALHLDFPFEGSRVLRDLLRAEDVAARRERVTGKADWATPADVKAMFRSANSVGDNRVIFDIGGNKYRLIVRLTLSTRRLCDGYPTTQHRCRLRMGLKEVEQF